MKLSQTGLVLGGLYVLLSVYLILTQGLFGQSFIVIILGLPWSLIPSFFEFGNVSGVLLYILVFIPLIINVFLFYVIGALLEKMIKKINGR